MLYYDTYIAKVLKSFKIGIGKAARLVEKLGTFLHSKAGSGQRAHGGHGGHGFSRGHTLPLGHAGQTGGTISLLRM